MEAIDVTATEVPKAGQSTTTGTGSAAPKSKIGKIIIGFIIVAVIVVIIFIATGNKASAAPIPTAATGGGANLQAGGTQASLAPKTTTTNTLAPKTTTPPAGCQINWSYKEGNGGYIQDLQRFLNKTNSANLVTDGYYGTKTDAEVQKWIAAKAGRTAAGIACATWDWKSGASGGSTQTIGTGSSGGMTVEQLRPISTVLSRMTGGVNNTEMNDIRGKFGAQTKSEIDATKARYQTAFSRNLYTDMLKHFSVAEAKQLLQIA